jgi:thymidylate synthase (FAD)
MFTVSWVTPNVYLIGATKLDSEALGLYLKAKGCSDTTAESFSHDSDALNMVSVAGKLCYNSFEVGLNPNVRSIRTDKLEHVVNMIKQKHGSVFEHFTFNFIFQNVSRVFTHELVRHRVGTAFSQESMRYVRPANGILKMVRTPSMDQAEMDKYGDILLDSMPQVLDLFDALDKETDFSKKKFLTSKIRRLLPHGIATDILFSCNIRQLAHIVKLRVSEAAEEEINEVFTVVSDLVANFVPYWEEMK